MRNSTSSWECRVDVPRECRNNRTMNVVDLSATVEFNKGRSICIGRNGISDHPYIFYKIQNRPDSNWMGTQTTYHRISLYSSGFIEKEDIFGGEEREYTFNEAMKIFIEVIQ